MAEEMQASCVWTKVDGSCGFDWYFGLFVDRVVGKLWLLLDGVFIGLALEYKEALEIEATMWDEFV